MKYTFVGDIHGKDYAVEAALDRDGMKIFVGDFMDSFDRTPKQHRRCLELVTRAIEIGEARAIYGNHELNYLMPRHRCSGWSQAGADLMREFQDKIEELFDPHIILAPDFLVTHAGLTKRLWDGNGMDLDSLGTTLSMWWHDDTSPVHYIGVYRGGNRAYGGTFWCDWNQEFEPVPGLRQVCGHSAGGSRGMIRQNGNSYNVDCLDLSNRFLTLEI